MASRTHVHANLWKTFSSVLLDNAEDVFFHLQFLLHIELKVLQKSKRILCYNEILS